MQEIIPMLAYQNGVAAIEWLCKAFGFVENSEIRFMEGERLTHAELKLNDNIIMLATPSEDYISFNKQRNEYSQMNKYLSVPYIVNGLLVYVDDVDTHFKNAKANGAEILSENRRRISRQTLSLRRFRRATMDVYAEELNNHFYD